MVTRSLHRPIRQSLTDALLWLIVICAMLTAMIAFTRSAEARGPMVQANSCGVRVYMTASGSSSQDAANDAAVKASLETNTDLCIDIGVNYYDLSTVALAGGWTTNYDVIYLQGQNNWGGGDRGNYSTQDHQVIEDFLTAGGGVVVGEWHVWNLCTSSGTTSWDALEVLMPVTIRGNCDYESNQKVRFFRWERPLSPLIDTGVGADFIFEPADFAGSLSVFDLKQGATPYYWATWDPNVNNIPPAVAPGQLPAAGGVGMAGWVPAGKTGRMFSFATTNGAPELTDTTSANSFRRLLLNSLGWAGSVGGSINPDAIAVSVAAGGQVSSPALVPSRFVGNVTYSIVSGTLPPGIVLNTSTGALSGSTTSGGTFNVTIQAVGSTSGSAQAQVTFTISGGVIQSPSTTTAPTTTTTPSNSSGQPTTSPTQLPETGYRAQWWGVLVALAGFSIIRLRRRLA